MRGGYDWRAQSASRGWRGALVSYKYASMTVSDPDIDVSDKHIVTQCSFAHGATLPVYRDKSLSCVKCVINVRYYNYFLRAHVDRPQSCMTCQRDSTLV